VKTVAAIIIVVLACVSCSNKQNTSTPQRETISSQAEVDLVPSQIPNMISVSGKKWGSTFLSSDQFYGWIFENQEKMKDGVLYGQVCAAIVNDEVLAFTAPHVINNSKPQGGFPVSEYLGPWKNSAKGHEVCFAKISDWKKFGLTQEPKKIAKPRVGEPARLKATCVSPETGEALDIIAEGVLEVIDGEELKNLASVMNKGTATRDRLENRAPKERILFMAVNPQVDPLLQGCSGAFVWQDDNPIGVFIAKFTPEDVPILVIEPLEDVFIAK
jgi:hypothetical protein